MQIEFIDQIDALSQESWNNLCASGYPFVRHEFLSALERSGSLGEAAGWIPQHLVIREAGELVAAMPMYIKNHSYGEYVFDWSWADAYHRYGLDYYPKLVTAIPFTPCAGARMLSRRFSTEELLSLVIPAIKKRAPEVGASGWHCLFPNVEVSTALAQQKISQRVATQFHWFNRGYQSWDDFVGNMNSRKRKNINKERRAVAEQGIEFITKSGAEITTDDWQLFFKLYRNTYLKRSGHEGYLTREFFLLLGKQFMDYSLLVIAQKNNQPIAAALFFTDGKIIYGRYWGCLAEYEFLHFETCYYQGIDYAIKLGLEGFDGGAQGEHKIQRGFEPVTTYSNHWLARSEFQTAINQFLLAEKDSVARYMMDAREHLPFKEK